MLSILNLNIVIWDAVFKHLLNEWFIHKFGKKSILYT